jgi:hypothetical protein
LRFKWRRVASNGSPLRIMGDFGIAANRHRTMSPL